MMSFWSMKYQSWVVWPLEFNAAPPVSVSGAGLVSSFRRRVALSIARRLAAPAVTRPHEHRIGPASAPQFFVFVQFLDHTPLAARAYKDASVEKGAEGIEAIEYGGIG